MLSLMSSVSDRLTGTRSLVNCVIGCGTPSSSMMKSFCSSEVTRRPSASRTVTAVVTSSEADRKVLRAAVHRLTRRQRHGQQWHQEERREH